MIILNSIRWRVQLWYGLILLLVIVAFSVSAYHLEKGRRFKVVDEELHQRLGALMASLRERHPFGGPPGRPDSGRDHGPGMETEEQNRKDPRVRPGEQPPPEGEFPGEPLPGGLGRPPHQATEFNLNPRIVQLFDAADTNGFYYQVWSREGSLMAGSSNAPAGAIRPEIHGTGNLSRRNGYMAEVYDATPFGDCMLVGHSLRRDLKELHQFALSLAGVGGTVLMLGLVGGWWLASRAIQPIESITATAVKIAAGDLSQRIDVEDTESELGRLTTVLNSTFARLDAAFAQQGRFTADAAHELRTPVSVIILQAQTALKSERTGPEYRKTIEACQRAAQRMKSLLESLLELARFDAGEETLNRMEFDLASVTAECMDLIEPLAQEKKVTLIRQFLSVKMTGDSGRIAQVITNLLNNAIHYNHENGFVRVSVYEENRSACVTINDTGPGISAEHLPRIFERFYRADSSRTHAGEHAGLGLSICRAIVSAHGGEITVSSEPGVGTTFKVRLPKS